MYVAFFFSYRSFHSFQLLNGLIMNVHILQHVPFEDIGSMARWFAKHNATLSYTRFFEKTALPKTKDFELIIAMGGPMSVNDELEFPWLKQEKEFIREAVLANVAVLGICLGAQLIASSLGASVYKNSYKEIGWFPIEGISNYGGQFNFPHSTTVFHWHGETFDLPVGAVQLAKSAACENQAFQLGRNVMGLQFHLETTPESAYELIKNCSNELVSAPYIQSKEQLRAATPAMYREVNQLMEKILDYLTLQEN